MPTPASRGSSPDTHGTRNCAASPDAFDIELDGERMTWNRAKEVWIHSPRSLEEVGSTRTVQGYDLDHAGVIIGPDLCLSPNGEIVTGRKPCRDKGGEDDTGHLKDASRMPRSWPSSATSAPFNKPFVRRFGGTRPDHVIKAGRYYNAPRFDVICLDDDPRNWSAPGSPEQVLVQDPPGSTG